MDIHRCRFVPYPPESINAIVFSHPSDSNSKTPTNLRLALGRASGDIEIWNPNDGNWFQETILRGGKDRSIEGVAWTQDSQLPDGRTAEGLEGGRLRLFSTGDSQSITEWDLGTGTPARHANGNFGDIWCLAAQPRPGKHATLSKAAAESLSSSSQLLAAGCGDGSIVLFSTDDNDLRFSKSLGKPPTKKPKVLSITWRDRNTIIAGYDDGVIRVFDIKSRTTLRSISLGKPAKGDELYVWCVKCLNDGTILSGDSSGELKIWDGENYSLTQRLKTHDADILDIATSVNDDMIITVGVDRRSVAYKPIIDQPKSKRKRWAQLMHRRFHQHDVKTIASFESKELSITMSGGVDTIPKLAPLKQCHNEYHRSLSNLPQRPQISSSVNTRVVLTWWGRELLLWRLPDRSKRYSQIEQQFSESPNYELVSRIVLNGDENVTSARISDDGGFIIAATVTGVKLFQVRMSTKEGKVTIKTRQIELPPSFRNFGVRLVDFSPDGRWLCAVRMTNVVTLAKMSLPESAQRMPKVLPGIIKLSRKPRKRVTNEKSQTLGGYLQTINHVVFSPDSRILATGDISGAVDVWLLEGHDSAQDSIGEVEKESEKSDDESLDSDSDDDGDDRTIIRGQKWIRNPAGPSLPQLGSAVLALTFRPRLASSLQLTDGNIGLHATRHTPHPISHDLPTDHAELVAITASHEVVGFDVLGCRLSDWTRRNPLNCLPQDFTKLKDRVMGCFWDAVINRDRLWLYGANWVFMLDLSQDLPASQSTGRLGNYDVLEPLPNGQKKRKVTAWDLTRKTKRNTGAGDQLRDQDAYVGIGEQMQRFSHLKGGDRRFVDMLDQGVPISDDVDEDRSALALLRRESGGESKIKLPNGHGESTVNGESKNHEDDEGLPGSNQAKRPGWWCTLNYRSIFGIVPIAGSNFSYDEESKNRDDTGQNLEVVIIERPIYDVDLPKRFDGNQDWET